MRNLKECYEIAKRHHAYWTGKSRHIDFMCLAAAKACNRGDLTEEEYSAITDDAMSLVLALDPEYSTIKEALGSAYGKDYTDAEVKDFWDKYIDRLGSEE